VATLEVALRNLTPMQLDARFDCASGELVALVGPSGSGKTSLLRAIAGLLTSRTLQGRVAVGQDVWFDSGQRIALAPQQRRAGLVFQHYALFPHLTALQNVQIACRRPGAPDPGGLLRRLGLAGLEQRRPAQLSGGQQQRVALARALAGEPQVLLLDEPFSAVDAPARQTLYHELAALRQGLATPMILVTHDLAEARRLADRVVIVDGGRSLQSGPPAQVFGSPRNARVAELVGIQNHFSGRFHKQEPGWGRLVWGGPGGYALRVIDKNRIPDDCAVTWVIAGEGVELAREARADVNALCCEVVEQLALGETSLCTLRPQMLPDQRVTLNPATAQLRSLDARVGETLWLRIAAEAVHIMPVKGSAADAAQAT
jgi:molybdate transport system ATP-binding protein